MLYVLTNVSFYAVIDKSPRMLYPSSIWAISVMYSYISVVFTLYRHCSHQFYDQSSWHTCLLFPFVHYHIACLGISSTVSFCLVLSLFTLADFVLYRSISSCHFLSLSLFYPLNFSLLFVSRVPHAQSAIPERCTSSITPICCWGQSIDPLYTFYPPLSRFSLFIWLALRLS